MVPEVGKGIYSNFSVTLLTYPTCFYLFFEVLLFALLAQSGMAAGRYVKSAMKKNHGKLIPIVFFGILSTQSIKYS